MNRSLYELHERSLAEARTYRLLRQQATQDVRELQIDQGRRGDGCFRGKTGPDQAAWLLVDDGPNPDASVGDGHLAPAAANQIHDLVICERPSSAQPGPRKDLAHALCCGMLSQHLENVGRQRHVDFIRSLAKSLQYRLGHIPDL